MIAGSFVIDKLKRKTKTANTRWKINIFHHVFLIKERYVSLKSNKRTRKAITDCVKEGFSLVSLVVVFLDFIILDIVGSLLQQVLLEYQFLNEVAGIGLTQTWGRPEEWTSFQYIWGDWLPNVAVSKCSWQQEPTA